MRCSEASLLCCTITSLSCRAISSFFCLRRLHPRGLNQSKGGRAADRRTETPKLDELVRRAGHPRPQVGSHRLPSCFRVVCALQANDRPGMERSAHPHNGAERHDCGPARSTKAVRYQPLADCFFSTRTGSPGSRMPGSRRVALPEQIERVCVTLRHATACVCKRPLLC